MSLEKMFLDMLSPDWYTEVDNANTSVGEYQAFSPSSQIGDKVFAYTLESDNLADCRQRHLALDAASMDNTQIYKIYGTVTDTKDSSCTIDADSIDEIPIKSVDGELCPISQQELYEDMEQEEIDEIEEQEVEETPAEEETLEESFLSLFGLGDDNNDDNFENKEELTEEEESNLLRMWDGSNSPKKHQYEKDRPFSFSQRNSHQSNDTSFSDKPFSHNQHNSWENNHDNQQNESHYEMSENDNLANSDFDANYHDGLENTIDNSDTMPDNYDDSNDTADDGNDSGKSEDVGIDIGM